MLPNRFAAVQHEPAYRLQPAVDQANFVQCTKILRNCLRRRLRRRLARARSRPISRSVFSLFPAFRLDRRAHRLIEFQRTAEGSNEWPGRSAPGRKFVLRLSALAGARRRPCRCTFRAGPGTDRLGPLQLDRGRRRHRQRARGGQSGRAAPPGEPRQADDPLHGVRGAARSAHHQPSRSCRCRPTPPRCRPPSSASCRACGLRWRRRSWAWSPSPPTTRRRRSANCWAVRRTGLPR